MAKCTTDELLETMFGRFHFEDWEGITPGMRKKIDNLPAHIRNRIIDKMDEINGNDIVSFVREGNPNRWRAMKRGVVPDERVKELAARYQDVATEAMGTRQKGQILSTEFVEAAAMTVNDKLRRLADSGLSMAEMLEQGGEKGQDAARKALKDLNEAFGLIQQIAGNQSEAGRLLRWTQQVIKDRENTKQLQSLFGALEC